MQGGAKGCLQHLRHESGGQDEQLFMYQNACTSTVFPVVCVIALTYQVSLPQQNCHFSLKDVVEISRH